MNDVSDCESVEENNIDEDEMQKIEERMLKEVI